MVDPVGYWVRNKYGFNVYEEEVGEGWWVIKKYDDNGKEIYYEDSYVGVLDRDRRKPLTSL